MRRPPTELPVALAVIAFAALAAQAEGPAPAPDPWQRLPGILAGIRPPSFPHRDLRVTDFGAVADGETDATAAFRGAVAACSRAGGGRVLVPPGVFLTGPIRLQSNVDLHVSEGATVRFTRDPAAYLPVVLTRWEGVELMNYSPLVYAYGERNVAVTGRGTLDGQADPDHWWPWKRNGHPQSQKPDRDRLFAQAEAGVPVAQRVYGAGHYLRPQFVETYRCLNVLIEGVTLTNAPMWVVHPVLSRNVTVRGIRVVSAGPNNDGCDPESSTDVLIEDSLFDTGDDCIAIKSGRNADGRRVGAPSERILERGIRIKTNAVRGGTVENVFVRDVEIGEAGAAIDIDMLYEEGAAGSFLPIVRNVVVERLEVRKARYAFFVRGLGASPVRGLVVEDSAFRGVAKGSRIDHVEDLVLRNVVMEPVD